MGEEIFLGIAALCEDDDFETGPGVEFGLDAGHELEVEVCHKEQRLKGLYLEAALPVAFPDLIKRHAGPFADLGQGGGQIPDVIADEGKAVGCAVIRQHTALDVEDAAPWRGNLFLAPVVFLGLAGEVFAEVHLQKPEAGHEDEKEDQDEGLKKDESASRRRESVRILLLDQDFRRRFILTLPEFPQKTAAGRLPSGGLFLIVPVVVHGVRAVCNTK